MESIKELKALIESDNVTLNPEYEGEIFKLGGDGDGIEHGYTVISHDGNTMTVKQIYGFADMAEHQLPHRYAIESYFSVSDLLDNFESVCNFTGLPYALANEDIDDVTAIEWLVEAHHSYGGSRSDTYLASSYLPFMGKRHNITEYVPHDYFVVAGSQLVLEFA